MKIGEKFMMNIFAQIQNVLLLWVNTPIEKTYLYMLNNNLMIILEIILYGKDLINLM